MASIVGYKNEVKGAGVRTFALCVSREQGWDCAVEKVSDSHLGV